MSTSADGAVAALATIDEELRKLKAIEACLEAKNEAYLIHIGYWNLDYYKKGDTFESLKARCENIIKENNLK